jgi:quercetin dioxygenase-like cupin family protein
VGRWRSLLVAGALVAAGCTPPPAPAPPPAPSPAAASAEDPGDDDEGRQIAAIERAVNELSTAVHSCWAIAAAGDLRVEGTVVLGLDIGAGGASENVEVLRDEPRNERLTGCLVELWGDYTWPEVFGRGDRIQLPPFRFVAPRAQYSVALAHVAPQALADGRSVRAPLLHEQNTGNAAAEMTLYRFEQGGALPVLRHPSAGVLYVLAGEGQVTGAGGKTTRLRAGDALYALPQTAFALGQRGEQPLVVVEVRAPAGGEADVIDPEARPFRSPAPLVRTTAKARRAKVAGGAGEVSVLFDPTETRDRALSLGAITLAPGTAIPAHEHAGSSEYLFVLEGEGEMTVEGQVIPVEAGDAIQIPAGARHAFVAADGGPVKAIQLYAPAGPEARLGRPEAR